MSSTQPYAGRFAALYDLFYADKPYEREATFIAKLFDRHAGDRHVQRILELACGTGSNARLLAKMGYAITATDRSADMIAQARDKAPNVDFEVQDMTSLEVASGPFDAVLCMFDSLGYLQTNESLNRALAGVRRHLRPKGLFIFDFWHAPAMIRHYSPTRVRRFAHAYGDVIRISETTLDIRRSTAAVSYTVFEPNGEGLYKACQETHTNRFFLCEEIELLAATNDFEVVSFFAGFNERDAITDDTWHVLTVLRAR